MATLRIDLADVPSNVGFLVTADNLRLPTYPMVAKDSRIIVHYQDPDGWPSTSTISIAMVDSSGRVTSIDERVVKTSGPWIVMLTWLSSLAAIALLIWPRASRLTPT